MEELPWKETLDRLKKHDKATIRAIYTSVFPRVRAYIEKNRGSRETAEDVFQEAMIALYRSIQNPGFQIQTSLTQYLFSVSKYIWIKKLKKDARHRGTYEVDEARIYEEGVEHIVMEDERHILLFEKLGLLSEDCRQVLTLFFQGFSMDEIARKMGYKTEVYARKRKYKCKQHLMKLIQHDPRYKELSGNG